jgi:hypothetical protein
MDPRSKATSLSLARDHDASHFTVVAAREPTF